MVRLYQPARLAAPPALLIALHGSGGDNPINPWAGDEVRPPGGPSFGRVVSAEATAAYFRQLAGLTGEPEVERRPDRNPADGAWVETRRWAGARGAEVVMLAVHGEPHTLPHPTAPFPTHLVGRISRDIDGVKTIGRFMPGTRNRNRLAIIALLIPKE